MSYDYAKKVLKDEALDIVKCFSEQTKIGRSIDLKLLNNRDEILAALAKLEEPTATPNEQAAETSNSLSHRNVLLDCCRTKLHDMDTAGWYITDLSMAINELEKRWPGTTPSLEAQYREALEWMQAKYKTYRDNIQWHIDTNKPEQPELNRLKKRVLDYDEVCRDLTTALNLKNKEV